MLETKPFDVNRYIETPADLAEMLSDAFASGHAPYITTTLGLAAKRYGMTRLAADTGLNRQALYDCLGEGGNPTLETLLKVVEVLGFRLSAEVATPTPLT